ncbi:glycoside hydrolase family 20 zincin-like fold domain-containing protein [Streptomyces sp. NPDC004726]
MLIPAPVHVTAHRGQLSVGDGDRIQAPPELAEQVDAFIADLVADGGPRLVREGSGRALFTVDVGAPMDVAHTVPAATGIDPSGRIETDARYALSVTPEGVVIRAADVAGVCHAFATMRQLLAAAPRDAQGRRGWLVSVSSTARGCRGVPSCSTSPVATTRWKTSSRSWTSSRSTN